MFSRRELAKLVLPLVVELIFTALMGTADTMMVARVGDAAVSGVSLVDAVNNLMLMVFTATATGGTIVCAQYLGAHDPAGANRAARQVLLCVAVISLLCCGLCVACRRPLLRAVFGNVEDSVMDAGLTYFWVTALSYPFIGVYDASAALYRASGDAKKPMIVSAIGNLLNIVGNAVFLFVFHWGVFGAALSTTLSRVFQCAVILILHRRPGQVIVLDRYAQIRPDWRLIRAILRVGIPTGVENGMFQLGKLMVQSTVALLSTAEIAAQAVVNTMEYFTSMPSMAIGLGLVTVAGQCMGAGRPEEAKHYTLWFTVWSEILILLTGIVIFLVVGPVCRGQRPQRGEFVCGVPNDAADYCSQAVCMASGVYAPQRHAGGRGCEILHAGVCRIHVDFSGGALCDSDPIPGVRYPGSMDCHVCGLGKPEYLVYGTVFPRKVDETEGAIRM